MQALPRMSPAFNLLHSLDTTGLEYMDDFMFSIFPGEDLLKEELARRF